MCTSRPTLDNNTEDAHTSGDAPIGDLGRTSIGVVSHQDDVLELHLDWTSPLASYRTRTHVAGAPGSTRTSSQPGVASGSTWA